MDEMELSSPLREALEATGAKAALALAALARAELLDDCTIAEHAGLFPLWDENWRGRRGDLAREGDALYRAARDIGSAALNLRPSEAPSLWVPIGDPEDEWPPWSAPLCLADAYPEGAQVSRRGIRWISGLQENTWEPGIYGWMEA